MNKCSTSDQTPASHTVMQSWPSQRCAEAGFGPRQSLSLALIRVPFLSCHVQATCLFWVPFPHVLEHGVHSVIIHLQRSRGTAVTRNQERKRTTTSFSSLAYQLFSIYMTTCMSSACHACKIQHSLKILSCKTESLLCDRVVALEEV